MYGMALHRRTRRRRLVGAVVGLVVGFVVLAVVGLAVTAVLDPFIWPSLLVGIPAGLVAGAAASVLVYWYLTRPADDTRNWRRIGGAVFVVSLVLVAVLAGLWVLGEQRIDETAEHAYQYQVTIATNESLDSPTFYVPVPTQDGASPMGERFVETVVADRYVPSMEGYDPDPVPVEFAYDLVQTPNGPMVAISADRIVVTPVYYRVVENETMGWHERIDPAEYDPSNPNMGVQDDGSFTFTLTTRAERPVDTANPFGHEPMLSGQQALTQVDCMDIHSTAGDCYRARGTIYADYGANATANVYVSTELEGWNSWFSGGWTGNSYREWSRVELHGPHSGWTQTDTELTVGRGRYR